MRSFLRFHAAGLLLSILIGAIIAAPPIIFHFSKDYQGVEMMKTNTETLYVPFVQEVYDGHPWLGNPYLADLKDNLYLFPPLSANIIAGFGKLFFLTPIEAVMVSRFFIAIGLSLLIYFFCFALTKRRAVGLVASAFVLLGYSLVDPQHLIDLFRQGDSSAEKTFIDYGRPLTPQISVLFFYGYLLSMWKFLEGSSKKMYGIIASILLGLSFYVYLFTWTFLFTLNASLILVYACTKNWSHVKKIVYISFGAVLIGIPYLWHIYRVTLHPWYLESATRFGFLPLRTPVFSRLVLGAALLFILGWKLVAKPLRLFFIAFFLTAFFVVNEQVVTGKFIFNHHYHWYYTTPLVIIFLVIVLFTLQKKLFPLPKFAQIVMVAALGLFLYNGVLTQYVSYRHALPSVIEQQRYAPLIAWLNTETPRDAVVLSSDGTDLIPALTHNNVYNAGAALYTLIPDERILHSYLVYAYLGSVPTTTIREYLESHRDEISATAFGYRYSFQKGVCTGCFPTSTIGMMVDTYQELTDQNFITFVRRYPVDYLMWDAKKHPEWDIGHRWKFRELERFQDIIVYDFREIS